MEFLRNDEAQSSPSPFQPLSAGARTSVLLGFLAFAVGQAVYLFKSVADQAHTGVVVYEVAAPVCSALLASAWWTMITATRGHRNAAIERAFKTFAVTYGLLMCGTLAMTLQLVADHQPHTYIVSYIFDLAGAALIAIGFWVASNEHS